MPWKLTATEATAENSDLHRRQGVSQGRSQAKPPADRSVLTTSFGEAADAPPPLDRPSFEHLKPDLIARNLFVYNQAARRPRLWMERALTGNFKE